MSCHPFLTRRFDLALLFASGLHQLQCRKGTNVPYISHLMAVSALVLEAGGDEDLAIAALLHDAPEDQGGEATLENIRQLFGDRVADVVRECTDTLERPKPPSRQRKALYLEHLKKASHEALLVSAADKLHNARAILSDHRSSGDEVFSLFNVGKDEQLRYYRELVTVLRQRCLDFEEFRVAGAENIIEELDRVVTDLEKRTANPEAAMA